MSDFPCSGSASDADTDADADADADADRWTAKSPEGRYVGMNLGAWYLVLGSWSCARRLERGSAGVRMCGCAGV